MARRKCHNSRPMVDSAPDLRRLCLCSTRTRSFAESPTLEEPCRPWEKLPMNHRRLSFIQTPENLSIPYYCYDIHHILTGMPEANGYYCQCVHLTTRTKHNIRNIGSNKLSSLRAWPTLPRQLAANSRQRLSLRTIQRQDRCSSSNSSCLPLRIGLWTLLSPPSSPSPCRCPRRSTLPSSPPHSQPAIPYPTTCKQVVPQRHRFMRKKETKYKQE